jgi:hypothetical protein
MKSLNLNPLPAKIARWQYTWKLQPEPAMSGFFGRPVADEEQPSRDPSHGTGRGHDILFPERDEVAPCLDHSGRT